MNGFLTFHYHTTGSIHVYIGRMIEEGKKGEREGRKEGRKEKAFSLAYVPNNAHNHTISFKTQNVSGDSIEVQRIQKLHRIRSFAVSIARIDACVCLLFGHESVDNNIVQQIDMNVFELIVLYIESKLVQWGVP
jgi:hypothetical protein